MPAISFLVSFVSLSLNAAFQSLTALVCVKYHFLGADMPLSLKQLEFCHSLSGEALMAAPLDDSDPLACVKQLRKHCAPEMASAVMTVRKVRQKAAKDKKFPDNFAARMLADERMAQQSSSFAAAMYAAGNLITLAQEDATKCRDFYDLCCGLGANSIAAAVMAQSSGITEMKLRGFDISDQACFCAAHNAKLTGLGAGVGAIEGAGLNADDRDKKIDLQFVQQDVTTLDIPAGAVVFIDPDRRADGRRSVLPSDCVPGDEFFRRLIDNCYGGAIKLSPACSAAVFNDWPVSWQYLSSGGRARQLLLWWPAEKFESGAVILHSRHESDFLPSCDYTFVPAACRARAEVAPVKKYIVVPDPAVIAAGAVDSLAKIFSTESAAGKITRLADGAAWLSSDEPIKTHVARCYEVLTEVKPREADIAKKLTELNAAQVEVKTFGLKLDTDRLGKKFSGKGENRLTVLWYADSKSHVYIAKRT